MKTEIQIATQKFKSKEYSELREIILRNPDFINTAGQMWLQQAIREIDIEALSILVELGVDVNHKDYFGCPLASAASHGAMESVKWLMNNGAKIDTSEISYNPLFKAIQNGHADLVKYFLDYGVDAKLIYPCGRDALAFSRIWGNKGIIELLGGDPNEKRSPWVKTTLPDLTGKKLTVKFILKMETEINLKFPKYFKEFLVNHFPQDLYFPNCKDNDDWEWLSEDYTLFHTARSFIAYNTENPELENKSRLFDGYIAIGTNGNGDFYCIKEGIEDQVVYFYDHELGEFSNKNTVFNEFVKELIEVHHENLIFDSENQQR